MARSNDTEYLERRECEERALAEQCVDDPAVAAVHLDMANRYAERLRGPFAESAQRRRLTILYGAG